MFEWINCSIDNLLLLGAHKVSIVLGKSYITCYCISLKLLLTFYNAESQFMK